MVVHLQIWQLRLREINLSKVTLSVVFWLQQMLFYINAVFFPQMRILVTLLLLIPLQ